MGALGAEDGGPGRKVLRPKNWPCGQRGGGSTLPPGVGVLRGSLRSSGVITPAPWLQPSRAGDWRVPTSSPAAWSCIPSVQVCLLGIPSHMLQLLFGCLLRPPPTLPAVPACIRRPHSAACTGQGGTWCSRLLRLRPVRSDGHQVPSGRPSERSDVASLWPWSRSIVLCLLPASGRPALACLRPSSTITFEGPFKSACLLNNS